MVRLFGCLSNAITSNDLHQRGTGLEYLDNLLPSDVRTRIIGLVEKPERTQAMRRLPHGMVADLAARLRSKQLTLRQLRREYRALLQADYDH